MPDIKVPFGLRNGRLYAPGDVQNGLACGCVCPGCGARLVANHPTRKVKYFSHHSAEGCAKGYETAMHLAAKQVLLDHKQLAVPSISATVVLRDKDTTTEAKATKEISATTVVLDSVEAEVREFKGVVPDIVGNTGGRQIFIEVAVTHFIDEEKRCKLEALGFPTVEIDLSGVSEAPTLAEIEQVVLHHPWNRRWIVNAKQQRLVEQATAEAQTELDTKIAVAKREIAAKKAAHERYLRLPDEKKVVVELQAVGADEQLVAPLIGIRVKGERSFGVSNRVWQAAVYARFIHGQHGSWFHPSHVYDALFEHFRVSEPFKDAPKIAIYHYLQHLCANGLLSKVYGGSYDVNTDSTRSAIPF